MGIKLVWLVNYLKWSEKCLNCELFSAAILQIFGFKAVHFGKVPTQYLVSYFMYQNHQEVQNRSVRTPLSGTSTSMKNSMIFFVSVRNPGKRHVLVHFRHPVSKSGFCLSFFVASWIMKTEQKRLLADKMAAHNSTTRVRFHLDRKMRMKEMQSELAAFIANL